MPSWLPWSSSGSSDTKKPTPITRTEVEHAAEDLTKNTRDLVASLYARAAALPPPLLILSTFALGGTTALGARYVYARNFKRVANGEWVTPQMLARRRWIKGYVTSVGDADNFRLYHTPGIGWRWPLKFRSIPVGRTDLKDQTIHIRLGGVDAPEAAHFGRPTQPYAEESLAWLKSQIEGRFIYCQLVRKDQYGRIVSAVHLKPRILPGWLTTGRDLSVEMLRAGWASVYEQAGAEYGKSGLDEFLRVQSEAQRTKKGIWKRGTRGETPAEYKKRYRDAAASGEPVAEAPTAGKGTAPEAGWFRRLFRLGSRQ
ncbi:SNase-domain-containing protein [Trametes versicolor FP-101664 SS1]|uniref:SNase-domain-containing protein n=1 Tax=Trametes versicolor (strain FP-101664) TaxID=717944 RepID=UPI000462449F|nr:SNase-domain-containing protein [Trametes versicolor FP-101664 SS1]EIW56856.1 SNase-domain-containing protein [Trametes versicolor FP-101664 SS1]